MIKWPNFRKKVPPAPNNVRKDPAVRFCWHVNATSFSFRRFLWSFFLPPPTFTSCSHHQFLSHLRRLFPPTHASAHTSDQDWWIKRWTQLELTKCVLQSGMLHFFHISYIEPNMQANKRVHTHAHAYQRVNSRTAAGSFTQNTDDSRQVGGTTGRWRCVGACQCRIWDSEVPYSLIYSAFLTRSRTCTLSEKALRPSFGVLFSSLSHYIGFHDGDLVKAPLQSLQASGNGLS